MDSNISKIGPGYNKFSFQLKKCKYFVCNCL